eukprot:CAMPEP_0178457288 /NCGR_PEP_ID=MMETSP0689_2-20121128/46939_1 /TAXON_ID=160604 /ORGANISM="Amphidinium massartii, Strain CS-259" /LENGTH=1237 /DNA_ID=CAMNT_0020083533 /DNA_START=5 /DNA_END=3715 /DNA_ORIENTATION=+
MTDGGRQTSASAWVWGASQAIGSDAPEETCRPGQLQTGNRPLQSLGVAWEQAFVVTTSGALWASGWNGNQCLFEDQPEASQRLARVDLAELDGRRVEALAGGKEHFLAILDGGDVLLSWGAGNEFGQAGQGTTSLSRVRPRAVSLPGPRVQIRQVACGELHSLFLTVAGTLYSCGDGTYGALGNGTKESTSYPQLVTAGEAMAMPLRSVSAGSHHNLALTVGGDVLAWGSNRHGRLGLGNDKIESVSIPTLVEVLDDGGVAVAAGGRHSAVILASGSCALAGDNSSQQLGHPSAELQSSSFFLHLSGEWRWRAVALGASHTLLLSWEGQLLTCGKNDDGQLGWDTSISSSSSPLRNVSLPKRHIVTGIAAGPDHSMALLLSSSPCEEKPAERSQLSVTAPVMRSLTDGAMADVNEEQPLKRTKAVRASDKCIAPESNGETVLDLDELPRTLSGRCLSALSQESNIDLVLQPSLSATLPGLQGLKSSVTFTCLAMAGVCSAAKFAGMDVETLRGLTTAATLSSDGVAELQRCLAAVFSVPALLNTSFCFPGLRRLRVDAEGLQAVFKRVWEADIAAESFNTAVRNALRAGLKLWGSDQAASGDTPPPLSHRDQVRGLAVLLHCPLLASSNSSDKDFMLMGMLMDVIAALPRSGRTAFVDVVVEDMATTLRGCLVPCVRDFTDAAIRKAAQSSWRSWDHVWSSLLVLDLLASANKKIQTRLQAELPGDLPQRTLSKESTASFFRRTVSFTNEASKKLALNDTDALAAGLWAPEPPVPFTDFHLNTLKEGIVPPEVELLLFERNAKGQMASPEDIELLRPQDERLHSFIVHRRLVPAAFLRRALQMENHFRHGLQQQRGVNEALTAAMTGQARIGPGGVIHINPNEVFLILQIRRDHLVEDTLQRLQDQPPEALQRQLKVSFVGEEGQDAGGVSREFFRLIAAQLFTVESRLFDKGVAEDARVLWFDLTSPRDPVDFWLMGVLLGLSVYNNLPGLDARLPVCLFRKLNGEPLGLEDLREVRPSVAGSLREMLAWKAPPGLDAMAESELFEQTFCLDFTVAYQDNGKTVIHELKEDGQNISVTMQNRNEFVIAYCKWVLEDSISKQFEAFKRGFTRVCSSDVFKALTGAQLAQIVLGEADLDLEHLRPKAKYEGYDPNSRYIEHFWDILGEFDAMQKRKFLAFVTGSDRAPVGGLGELQLLVQRAGVDCDRLPSAHTCFNALVLPEYSSRERLRGFLLTAI